eukprot:TRINITY_DN33070_c0_g1_i1.p1 TRINITY_DN33070_c0_g1~~TRINITY_DN33070_c0_g1_i1.p1  ORF type:complete len:272 (-),score=50.82 TRINITY_DN33070_c0_g1_i1:59-874(-)
MGRAWGDWEVASAATCVVPTDGSVEQVGIAGVTSASSSCRLSYLAARKRASSPSTLLVADMVDPPFCSNGRMLRLGLDIASCRLQVEPENCSSQTRLLPASKRMRPARPTLGQLRLQREAADLSALTPEVHLTVDPEHLRAAIIVEALPSSGSGASPATAAKDARGTADMMRLQFELQFPPQYPHRPPTVKQVAPAARLSAWQYDDQRLLLARLGDRTWSPAMGLADIIQDLLQPMHNAGLLSNSMSTIPGSYVNAALAAARGEDQQMEVA